MKRVLGLVTPLAVAALILVVSIFSSSQVEYVFGQSSTPAPIFGEKVNVEYQLPYAGKVQPDSLLWPVKALRDRVWIVVSLDPVKKAQVLMLLANKRIIFAQNLMLEDNSELSVSTLTKSEKYLEQAVAQEKLARSKKLDTKQLLQELAMSTLKHRQILEEILTAAPEDAKPVIVKTLDANKHLYSDLNTSLNSQGLITPQNPFED